MWRRYCGLWRPYVIWGALYFCPVVSFYLLSSFYLFSSPNLSGQRLDVYPSANLECRSEMCCSRLAAITRRKKVAKNRHLCTIAQLRRAISSQLRQVSTIGKKLLSSNTSSTCPYNMVNFGPLAAEILSLVWGTPGNFNGFLVLASLLQRRRSTEVNQTLQYVLPSPGLVRYIYTFGISCP